MNIAAAAAIRRRGYQGRPWLLDRLDQLGELDQLTRERGTLAEPLLERWH